MAPWAGLPEDLFRTILEKLSIGDLVRSSAVCKDWWDKSKGIRRKSSPPWIFYLERGLYLVQPKLFDPCSRESYDLKTANRTKIFDFIDAAKLCASKKGWLLFARKVEVPCETLFLVYSPISNDYFWLPTLTYHHSDVATFSTNPTAPDCVFFISYRHLGDTYIATYSSGKDNWSTQKVEFGYILYDQPISSVVYSEQKGEFYCVCVGGELAKFAIVGRRWDVITQNRRPLKELAAKTWQHQWLVPGSIRHWLFQYEGQLLLVFLVRNLKDRKYMFSISYFDWSQNRWAVKDNVGNFAVMLSSLSSNSPSVLLSRVEDAEDCLCKHQVSSVSNLKVYGYRPLFFTCKQYYLVEPPCAIGD
ncbi:F-box protein At3g56470-like [Coffea arabica]|uniref:F-box protein At3g56470-like n=1 Tax=Coffea arabica TaxID=13443 RepID=A0A6P6VJM5_COFAR|nr:F-box protein At3g56470-like [Coffea arabica]